ncbi:hypothetical protein NC652_007838 [Populus alba x Populus x berolinensis]|uniref:Uncharacterized protein n=1 Tax=Populus alba x Populus x berolinensis TaxID=444605 RepID=A0AAD6R4Y7_9ROSI|nr:hypothetical protein NC652_007837 [Populus alba x Populus x berolinensis]KAJ6941886.1 hypothetical protein NC652_007838 [Populus alba x Populus x berolinensis]KAJ7002479.1 hypothetical protein NC653_007838 [Populus alba x Populus x berolinensis]
MYTYSCFLSLLPWSPPTQLQQRLRF